MDLRPLTKRLLPDLADLFAGTAMTRRCHCTGVLIGGRAREELWLAGRAQEMFEETSACEDVPLGVLAFEDGRAVGWCAVGPRSRYAAVHRSPLWRGRDESEDDVVWLVACFYVRAAARHQGLVLELLDGAVDLAREHGAAAVEGMPRSAGERVDPASSYVGFESVFIELGFEPLSHPTPYRTHLRLDR